MAHCSMFIRVAGSDCGLGKVMEGLVLVPHIGFEPPESHVIYFHGRLDAAVPGDARVAVRRRF